jgi:hypothetical protein
MRLKKNSELLTEEIGVMGLCDVITNEKKVISINELKYKKYYKMSKCINYHGDFVSTYDKYNNKNNDIARRMIKGYLEMWTNYYSKGGE